MTASAVPAAIDALVSTLAATLGAANVFDGPGVSNTGAEQYVLVGVDDADSDGYVTASTGQQGWAWLGHQQRDETFTVHCVAVGWNGNGDQKAARDSVYAAMKSVTNAITADPTLGGVALYLPGVTSHDLQQMQNNNGATAHLRFDVECRARLS